MSDLIDVDAPVKKQLEPFQGNIEDKQGEVSRDLDLDEHQFIPWPGRILVKKFPRETTSKGGVEIHGTAAAEKNWGRVVRIPDSADSSDIADVVVGTVVMWLEGAGVPLDNLGEDLILLDYRNDFDHDLLGFFLESHLQSSDD